MTQYVRVEGCLINPSHVKHAQEDHEAGLQLVLTEKFDIFVHGGTVDGWLLACRRLLTHPKEPCVDLQLGFRYERSQQPDDDPIPDEEATKV